MLARQRKPELGVIESRALEGGALIVAIETVLRLVADRMVWCVAVKTRAGGGPLADLGVLVTLCAALLGVLPFQFHLGVFGVLALPRPQQLAAQ
jgi:hypothetical protein